MLDFILWCFQALVAVAIEIVWRVGNVLHRIYVKTFRLRRRLKGEPLVQPHDAKYGFDEDENEHGKEK